MSKHGGRRTGPGKNQMEFGMNEWVGEKERREIARSAGKKG
jgi:hypothetical protein